MHTRASRILAVTHRYWHNYYTNPFSQQQRLVWTFLFRNHQQTVLLLYLMQSRCVLYFVLFTTYLCGLWYTECQPLLQFMRHIVNDFDSLCENDKKVSTSFGQGMSAFFRTEEHHENIRRPLHSDSAALEFLLCSAQLLGTI